MEGEICGCVVGGQIGVAMGSPPEGKDYQQIHREAALDAPAVSGGWEGMIQLLESSRRGPS